METPLESCPFSSRFFTQLFFLPHPKKNKTPFSHHKQKEIKAIPSNGNNNTRAQKI